MTRYWLRKWKRQCALATISAGFMAYASAMVPAALAQDIPRQLPPNPPPALPSVSEYSLPPGESQEAAENTAEGPVDENAIPPQAVPSVAKPSELRPLPVPDTPVQTTRQPDIASVPPSNSREPRAVSTAATAPPSITQTDSSSSDNQKGADAAPEQPTPGFSTNFPASNTDTRADMANDEAIVTSSTQEARTDTNTILIVAVFAIFLVSMLAIYLWRRKTITKPLIFEEDNPAPSGPPASTSDRKKTRPKIYSPPVQVTDKKSAQDKPGYVTSKIPAKPALNPSPASSVVVPKADVQSAEKESRTPLKMAFLAQSASSTLLNAVLGYEIKLTNESGAALTNIRLFGAMMQANSPAAKNADESLETLLHEIASLESGETLAFTGDMRLPLNAIRPISFKSQALLIPLTRFRTAYCMSNEERHEQTSAFIIGQEYEPRRPKMAPFRLDLGPRIFDSVGYRRLTV
ncbi:MAG: hypothetical protein ABJO01_08145 [Parasphingorhabdus sp.]|uniref:hypothetical protein n=1 Tax=Parasphingorhabdus sp. TaxID=2709688 RepID=UPI003299AB7F